jgi:hypothetical protein
MQVIFDKLSIMLVALIFLIDYREIVQARKKGWRPRRVCDGHGIRSFLERFFFVFTVYSFWKC